MCTIGCLPNMHIWKSEQRERELPTLKTPKMAAWKENRNCQRGKTRTAKICRRLSTLDCYANTKILRGWL